MDEKSKMHHESYGNFFANQILRAEKLISELSSEGNPFTYTDLRNLVNFSVPNDFVRDDVLSRDRLGVESVLAFRKDRMSKESKVGFWDPYSKKGYKMFSEKEIIISKTKNVITTFKEEKLIYSRMMVMARTHPDLCPEKVIGEYELTNIPPSNFNPDGTMILAKSNDSLIDLINGIRLPSNPYQHLDFTDDRCVLIVDGLDILESLKSVKSMENVGELADLFIAAASSELDHPNNYSEVRLLFTRFVSESVNESKSRQKYRTPGKIKQYHITEKTPVKKLESFLAHVETRHELTKFLGNKILKMFATSKIQIVVGFGSMFHSNNSQHRSDILEKDHTLEEMHQLVLIHAVDLKNNGVERLHVKSISTDVFVVLLGHINLIPKDTTIVRNGRSYKMNEIHHRIGTKLADSLIGWYSMQGERFCIIYLKSMHIFASYGVIGKLAKINIAQQETFPFILKHFGSSRFCLQCFRVNKHICLPFLEG